MTTEMEFVVGCDGVARCIYDEGMALREIGTLKITRASHVEPDAAGYWWADMGPVDGPVLGPYGSRSEALGAERAFLINEDIADSQDKAHTNATHRLHLLRGHIQPSNRLACPLDSLVKADVFPVNNVCDGLKGHSKASVCD
jgi:hypothetical protein